MKQLWAPWRIEYLLNEKEEGCLFCRAFQTPEERQHLVLVRQDRCLCMLNRYPYNNGHLLIAPRTHASRLEELEPEDLLALLRLAQQFEGVLARTLSPGGYNLGLNLGPAAGAGIADHLHLHLVPRWHGDTNFMAVIDHVRVVPQALLELYDLLRNEWDRTRPEA